MTYRVGDIPATSLVVVPTIAGNVLDLDPFDSVTVSLTQPDGTTAAGTGTLTATIANDEVSVSWPSTSWFTTPGMFFVQLVLHSTGGALQSADSFPFVVEQPDGWHSLASARAAWTTGAPRSDVQLYNLLQTAKFQFSAFAPAISSDPTTTDGGSAFTTDEQFDNGGGIVPQNYRDGQLLQAKNLWNATLADPNSNGGNDEFAPVRPFPMDRWVKSYARPVKGVPTFG